MRRSVFCLQPLRSCKVLDLPGLTEYDTAWRYQKALLEHSCAMQKSGTMISDSLILLEHSRVFTLGRGATTENLKFSPDASPPSSSSTNMPRVIRIERGGEVTWHGPGQLVAYPILNLAYHKKDLHWYTTALEECVIKALESLGVRAGRNKVNTGVWVGPNKISAIGVTASRWHTMHGVSINISNSLSDYDHIIPCGIAQPGLSVCRVKDVIDSSSAIGDAALFQSFKAEFVKSFATVFSLQLQCDANARECLEAIVDSQPGLRERFADIPSR